MYMYNVNSMLFLPFTTITLLLFNYVYKKDSINLLINMSINLNIAN